MSEETGKVENQRLGRVIGHTGREVQVDGIGDTGNLEFDFAQFLSGTNSKNFVEKVTERLSDPECSAVFKSRLLEEADARGIIIEL